MATKQKEAAEAPSSQLHNYELVFVVHPEVADDALDAVIEGVQQFITAKKGTFEETAKWGRRRLAYPIKRFLETPTTKGLS